MFEITPPHVRFYEERHLRPLGLRAMKPTPILSVHELIPLPVDHDRQHHIQGLLVFIKRCRLRGEKAQSALWQWIYSDPHREEWRVALFTRMLRRLKRSQERQGVSDHLCRIFIPDFSTEAAWSRRYMPKEARVA